MNGNVELHGNLDSVSPAGQVTARRHTCRVLQAGTVQGPDLGSHPGNESRKKHTNVHLLKARDSVQGFRCMLGKRE